MKKIVLLPAFLLVFCFSCDRAEKPAPEDNRQYSYWTVNEDSFSTNDVEAVIGKGTCIIGTRPTDPNAFSLRFYMGYELPVNGSFQIKDTSIQYSDWDYVGIDFSYESEYYFIPYPSDHYVTASSVNGKAQYKLPPTWFYSYYHPDDSVLIAGTFNEP